MSTNHFINLIRSVLIIALISLSSTSRASHIVGTDLYYTHVSGSTYKISLAVYGDCGPASAAAFALLSSSAPQVCVYNGSAFVATLSLAIEPPTTGVEITPLCAGSISQCTSSASPIPGIKKFVYSVTYTMPSTSTVWRFIFDGNMGASSSAGRAAAITNIMPGSMIQLIDTLNNSTSDNSSPTLTTTQSTFFNLNNYDSYNPAATDPDGDIMGFSLAPAMNGTATCSSVGGSVAYTGTAWPGQPITPSTPLQVSAGTFALDTTNGKISFYPNLLQRAVVVYNIREYRSGVLVGTSQREMTVTVISGSSSSPCSGMPTAGSASVVTGCGGAADTLTLTGYSCAGVSMQWQSSPDGVTWTNISGATANTYAITPSSSLYFRCKVTCLSSGLPAYTGSVFYPLSSAGTLHCSVSYPPDTVCTGLNFHIAACLGSGSYTVQTYFGDATSTISTLTGSGLLTADITHNYSFPGTYYIKQVLYSGTTPMDSLLYSYEYMYCRILPLKFYNDANSNCVYDAGDNYLFMPVTVQIDSNGVPVDTVTATGGYYFRALGGPGTIYSFTILSAPAGLSVACPSSGTLNDTIVSSLYSYPENYFGFHCTTAGVDLQESAWFIAGQHIGLADITVVNANCTSVNDTVTMHFSPQYAFYSAVPTPLSVSGTTIKWLPGAISASSAAPQHIQASFHEATALLTAGDTVHSDYQASPLAGDLNPTDNYELRVDTVSASWDPNAMLVTPQGYITAGTQLEYAVHFENTGNGPAHDIYVLDTLSSYLNFQTIKVTGATSAMNLGLFTRGAYTIAKFDFPNINLPDSSHHDLCNGMVTFKINTKAGLAAGTVIPNRAGIYFDINPVVMTNTVNNIIGTGPVGVGSNTPTAGDVTIYPNPALGYLNIEIATGDFQTVAITNIVGTELLSQKVTSSHTELQLGQLSPGLYYVVLKGTSGTVVRKIVKQ